MQNQEDGSLTQRVFAEIGEYGPKRNAFIEAVYRDDKHATRRRAAGRVSQWSNPDDMHRLPLDHARNLIEACGGECAWLDELVDFARECRQKQRRQMRTVRPGAERDRRAG